MFFFCQQLTEEGVPEFADNLNAAVQNNKSEIVNSSSTISAIVSMLNTISNVSPTVNQTVMKVGHFLNRALKNLSLVSLQIEPM